MSDFHSIYWDSKDAKLKSYSANLSSRAGKCDVTLVKIELEVSDHHRLSYLLESLGEIKSKQETPTLKKPGKKPLLLTYDPNDGGAA